MSKQNRKCQRPIWVNVVLLVLLLLTSGFTLTGCGLFKLKSQPMQQEKTNLPAGKDSKDEKADKSQENDNDKSNVDKKYEAEGQDNQDDDDPE